VTDTDLFVRFDGLQSKVAAAQAGQSLFPSDINDCTNFAIDAAEAGRNDLVIALLVPLSGLAPRSARVWQLLSLAWRDEQQGEKAAAAIAKAVALAPEDSKIVLAHAQVQFETGRPAAHLFRTALRMDPGNLEAIRSAAAALVAEGQASAGQGLLEKTLRTYPGWLAGHQSLASIRTVSGEGAASARSYGEAVKAQPRNLELRLAWFQKAAAAQDWELARAIVRDGEAVLGEQQMFAVARLLIASESGEASEDGALFEPVADLQDPQIDLHYVRHSLRCGMASRAEEICERHIRGPMASAFWPYLSLAWRLLGDARAHWLDGEPSFHRFYDLDVSTDALAQLSETLRKLHVARAPFLDQSVRHGTQTDGHLFLRHEQPIQDIRTRIWDAVQAYVKGLPPFVEGHPLLGAPRANLKYEGSWSVRLASQGFHVCHTHTKGWISSAFYVSLPEVSSMGNPPAGWLALGMAPPELKLDLPARAFVEPKPGRLVLFPSTMWHSTIPFAQGERLTIAFDVQRPSG
jgi:tetratricopeptide (TPR) repeat protein